MTTERPFPTGTHGAALLRTAAYIRVSTDSPEQMDSYELQEEHFTVLLSGNPDWISAGVYCDHGISGTITKKRTGFRRLLRHCREGRIDRIVTKSISRFARNTMDLLEAVRILRERHITILFEQEHLDTADPIFGDFILTTLGAISQEQSRTISENILWGIRKRYQKGDSPNFAIYGYRFQTAGQAEQTGRLFRQAPEAPAFSSRADCRYRQVEPVPAEEEIVRYIYQEAASGTPCTQIARALNLRRIPAPARPSSPSEISPHPGPPHGWTGQTIGRILRSERYTGDALLQKTYTTDHISHTVKQNHGDRPQYMIRCHHPAIITRELFQEVQEIQTARPAVSPGKSTHTRYPFSGRLICGCCGRHYHTRNRNYYPVWFCPSAGLNNGIAVCHSEKIYEEQLIRMLQKAVLQRFLPAGKPAAEFLYEMQKHLLHIQENDYFEQERTLQKHLLLTAAADPHAGQQKLNEWKESLASSERYWEKLEQDYPWRQKALDWIQKLPRSADGFDQFLSGLAAKHVKAFVLSVTIHDPFHYTVRWFDNSRTDVTMQDNIKDHRLNVSHFKK